MYSAHLQDLGVFKLISSQGIVVNLLTKMLRQE